jgi:hypothetical protein
MAPLPTPSPLSLLTTFLSTHLPRSLSTSRLTKRDDTNFTPGQGTIAPTSIPSNAVFAIFGLIGAGFVVTGIWFFFWAKNGGFVFKEGDWEDYKSTVLRRKGPNGTTLSGATRTTDLGGGSVVGKRYRDFESETSGSTGTKSVGKESEMSEVMTERSSRHGRERDAEKEEKKKSRRHKDKSERREKKHRRAPTEMTETTTVESVSLVEEDAPPEADEAVRAYRHEKPAKVGGLNRVADGSAFEGSSHDSNSELLANRERTPTNSPKKIRKSRDYTGSPASATPGIRKVETVSGRREDREARQDERIRAEARRLQEIGRSAGAGSGRRNFSYTPGDDASDITSQSNKSERVRMLPGSYTESDIASEAGTKSYHHPIPGLSSTAGSSYVDERRKKRAEGRGYRRGDE